MKFVEAGYIGDQLDHKRHGHGQYTWEDGSVYVGGWKHDKRDGAGKFTYTDGDVYGKRKKDGTIMTMTSLLCFVVFGYLYM